MITKKDVNDSYETAILIHDEIIKYSGGETGIRDEGGLKHSISVHIENINKNPDTAFTNAAKFYKTLATRHYFTDGNKRTAHILVKLYLLSKHIRLNVKYAAAGPFIISIAAENKTLKEIENWLRANSAELETKLDRYIYNLQDDIEEMERYKKNQEN